MAKKKLSARAQRRAQDRRADKLAREAGRLFELSPGGSAAHPIELVSASEVEPYACGVPCPACLGELNLQAHEATTVNGARLRVTRMRCKTCGRDRSLWFRIGPVLS